MKRTLAIYLILLALFGTVIFTVIQQGRGLLPPGGTVAKVAAAASTEVVAAEESLWAPLAENFKEPLARLFLQVIVIVLATRTVGGLFARFGQPAVVGEVLAGILLGPSLLGWLSPELQHFIFPKDSMGTLKLLSQIGVCLFMFVVGLELEIAHLKQKAQQAVIVSHVSILFPFTLGVLVAWKLFGSYAGNGTTFTSFALFMGIALSITAFPVLARILKERRMEKTFLGTTAIACAAVDDATAWIILAFVVAITRATSVAATALGLAMVILFVGVMLVVIRPYLPRWLRAEAAENPSRSTLVAVLLVLMTSALATELIGVHALFGAFIAGVAMPESKRFREQLIVRMENFSSLFLLPLFFAFSGLRTQVELLNDPASWLVCGAIIAVATLGKLGGTLITARLTGMGWNDSFALGALMNTRGLVELVALNIGYDLGILSPRIFAMLVLMALVTTFMTGPLLNLAERLRRRSIPAGAPA
jgi:Kef-type K+ transport system membrane component KefB